MNPISFWTFVLFVFYLNYDYTSAAEKCYSCSHYNETKFPHLNFFATVPEHHDNCYSPDSTVPLKQCVEYCVEEQLTVTTCDGTFPILVRGCSILPDSLPITEKPIDKCCVHQSVNIKGQNFEGTGCVCNSDRCNNGTANLKNETMCTDPCKGTECEGAQNCTSDNGITYHCGVTQHTTTTPCPTTLKSPTTTVTTRQTSPSTTTVITTQTSPSTTTVTTTTVSTKSSSCTKPTLLVIIPYLLFSIRSSFV